MLSLVWLGGLGSLLAVIFGYMSDKEARRAGRRNSGMATAGFILGWIGLAILGIVVVFWIVALASTPQPGFQP